MKEEFKKILIIRYEHIGDFGLTIPAIDSIRKEFPKAQIDVVVGSWNKDFAEAVSSIDNIIYFDNPLVERNISRFKIIKSLIINFRKILGYIRRINKEGYDLVINFSDRKFVLATDKWIKAKNKILGINLPYKEGREVDRNNEILSKYLGINNFVKRSTISYSSKHKKIVESILNKFKIKNKRVILIHPITPLEYKNWNVDNWILLIKEMNMKYKNLFFILIGGPEQEKEIKDIVDKVNLKNVGYTAGKLNVPESILLISKAKLILGGDSGPVHWAELTNTKIINLYGPTGVIRWAPPKDQGVFIKKGDKINNILVKDVMKEVERFL